MAAQVKVSDNSLWTAHIHGDSGLQKKLESLPEGGRVSLRVGGKQELFEKMRNGPQWPTPGLKPVDGARGVWGALYRERRGELVEIALDDSGISAPSVSPVPLASTPQQSGWSEAGGPEREAAWEAFKALSRAGWRSDAARGDDQDRDELHRR
jgi:hypothetical protein